MSKTWLITGSNRGLGRVFATAALERGDRVAATARNPESLADLVEKYGDRIVPLQLDVTSRDQCRKVAATAAQALGHLDVVVNNAGYGLFGMVEEVTEQQMRDQMEVNFFGLFHMTQAVLPILRGQGHGHIVQLSTIGGIVSFAGLGAYHASKWAVEGLSEALSQELVGTGVRLTLVEPGPYQTDWAGNSAVHAMPIDAYAQVRDAMQARQAQMPPELFGEPEATGPAILALVDSDTPPLRLFLGVLPTMIVPGAYADRLATWDSWKEVAVAATRVNHG